MSNNNRGGTSGRRRLTAPSSRGHRQQQWSAFPQTKQRQAASVQERNQQLQYENLELRSQNSDLARQLNDVRVKLQAAQQQKRDLERRLAQIEANNRRDKALAREAIASATTNPPSLLPVGLKGFRTSSESATPVYPSGGTLASPVSPMPGQDRWQPQSGEEAVRWVEERSPERVHARRGRRASILPNTSILQDHLTRDRQAQHPQQRHQQGRTPSPPPMAIQPQSPSPYDRSALSWSSLAGSDTCSSQDAPRSSGGSGRRGRGDAASRSLERSGCGGGGRIGSRSLELPIGGGDMGGASRSLELSGDGGDGEESLSASAPTPASSSAALFSFPSEDFHSPNGDSNLDPHHDSGSADSLRPATEQQLRMGRIASTLAWSQQKSRSEEATESPAWIGTADSSTAASSVASTTTTTTTTTTTGGAAGRGLFPPPPPPPPGSPQEMPGRSRSSTPFPPSSSGSSVSSSSSSSSPSSNRLRPRRSVARPVSYQEPSLNIKMRKGHVMFPKEPTQSDDDVTSISVTVPPEEKENQR